jgi:hypothetical protein
VDVAERFRIALELHDLGVAIYRQRVVREHPEMPEPDVDALVQQWLHTRPGAEHGDAVGPHSDRFR